MDQGVSNTPATDFQTIASPRLVVLVTKPQTRPSIRWQVIEISSSWQKTNIISSIILKH